MLLLNYYVTFCLFVFWFSKKKSYTCMFLSNNCCCFFVFVCFYYFSLCCFYFSCLFELLLYHSLALCCTRDILLEFRTHDDDGWMWTDCCAMNETWLWSHSTHNFIINAVTALQQRRQQQSTIMLSLTNCSNVRELVSEWLRVCSWVWKMSTKIL